MTVHRTVKLLLTAAAGLLVLAISGVAFAQEADATVLAAREGARGWIALGAGIGLGLAAFGGALGQGRAASAALDGIARNPGASGKVFTPLILALALIESLVIFTLLIAFMLYGQL